MVVVNHTSITGEEMKNLLSFSAKRAIHKRYLMSLVVAIFGVAIFIASFINTTGSPNVSLLIFSAMFMALGIGYFIMSLVSIKTLPKKLVKENKDLCEYGCNYIYQFKENSMKCENKINGSTAKFDYDYSRLKKVYEYQDRYELRFEEEMVAYVYKNGFSEPKMEEFFISNITINRQMPENSRKRIRLKIKKRYKEENTNKKSEN